MSNPRQIIWTKSKDSRDKRIWDQKYPVHFWPMIALVELELPKWPEEDYDVVMASRFASELVSRKDHPWREQLLKKTIHTFGAVSAELLQKAGYKVNHEQDCKNLSELYERILLEKKCKGVHFIGAVKSSTDPKSISKTAHVIHSAIYENKALNRKEDWSQLNQGGDYLVCVASASATRNSLKHLQTAQLKNVSFACIGQESAKPLNEHDYEVLICHEPKIELLVELAQEWYKKV